MEQELNQFEKATMELKNQRAQIRASIDLQEGLIAEARTKHENPKEDRRAVSKLEHELKDLKASEAEVTEAINEVMAEAKEAKRAERREEKKAEAKARLFQDMAEAAQGIDAFLEVLEAILDNDTMASRLSRIIGKATKLGARTGIEIQLAVATAKAEVKAEYAAKASVAKETAKAAARAAGSPAMTLAD